MLPYINIFGLALPLPALTILLGIWLGLSVSERYAHKHQISPEKLYNLVFISLIAGVIGARLTYVIQFPSAFIKSPGSLISPNPGLFDISGGVVAGIIVSLVYGQRKKLSLWPTLDSLTPAFAVFAIAVSLSNLASGNAFGSPTTLPWGIELWSATRHPSQIYEAIGGGLILWYLWPGRKAVKPKPGIIFLQFITLSALSRLFFEAFRGSSPAICYNIRVVQVYAWLILAASLWGLSRITKETNPSN